MTSKLVIETNKPLAPFSTFGIGGPAKWFCEVKDLQTLEQALHYCKENQIPFHLIGKGSNTLFDDQGFSGMIILNKVSYVHFLPNHKIQLGSGMSFSHLGTLTARKQLHGLEFASGIPGTVGGAIFMNAGANGYETADFLEQVTFIHINGKREVFSKDQLSFSYRTSPFQQIQGAIAEAIFALSPSTEARAHQLAIIDYRKKTQPLQESSAGCTFRNPQDHSAGSLIEACGLKGFRVGGAEVSTTHANFIINTGMATSKDVLSLIDQIQSEVSKKKNIQLECEIRHLTYDFV